MLNEVDNKAIRFMRVDKWQTIIVWLQEKCTVKW